MDVGGRKRREHVFEENLTIRSLILNDLVPMAGVEQLPYHIVFIYLIFYTIEICPHMCPHSYASILYFE